jgi:nucleotide-binding universal stress UspA family protein
VKQLRRVLTAVDFSDPARTAFDYALGLSRANAAELTAVHVVPTDRSFDGGGLERIALAAELRQAANAAGVRLKMSVQNGDPARVILRHARARRPDLIVLGTNARSGIDRVRFGSVAETVLLRAEQPVLIVPASPTEGAHDSSFNSILVAVDFSAGSISAVETALSITNENSRVTLAHVVPGVTPAAASRYMYRLMEPEYQRVLAREAWRRMPEIMPVNSKTKVHARVVTGDVATEIARVATEVNADLILIGVTPRGPIARRIFRSTAARVMRTAGRPVLAIPERRHTPIGDETNANRPATAA